MRKRLSRVQPGCSEPPRRAEQGGWVRFRAGEGLGGKAVAGQGPKLQSTCPWGSLSSEWGSKGQR